VSGSLRRILLAVFLLCLLGGSTLTTSALSPLAPMPQQLQQLAPSIASYQMNVRLDPATKTISGVERITYSNPSPAALNEIWLRLYLRAFRDANTAWMREYGRWRDTLPPEYVGDITVNSLTLAGGADLLASATLTDTLMRVPLPQRLMAHQRQQPPPN
jgi:hypothetical protein